MHGCDRCLRNTQNVMLHHKNNSTVVHVDILKSRQFKTNAFDEIMPHFICLKVFYVYFSFICPQFSVACYTQSNGFFFSTEHKIGEDEEKYKIKTTKETTSKLF